ncbi:MAG: DUF3150 domain-containing protein, partial [Armatimonadetes bacterium]|nr:DUF3150 domain-containing protein [Armatimonadota bacterium]
RAGNLPAELNLTQDRIARRAIATYGTKDLIDPEQGRKVFALFESQARHALAKVSQPFPAAGAHFVPWQHAGKLIETLDTLKTEFDAPVAQFIAAYPQLKADWQAAHPDVPDAAYPPVWELKKKFGFGWHSFKVSGAAATQIDDIEAELHRRQIQDEQLAAMKSNLAAECQQFVAEYVLAFRQEVAAFCDQVIAANGQVHGKTLQAIRRKIDHFHAMNIFADADTAAQLQKLKAQIHGLTGEQLAEQPKLAEKLSQACALLKAEVLDADSVSALTGRLKRRVVLD